MLLALKHGQFSRGNVQQLFHAFYGQMLSEHLPCAWLCARLEGSKGSMRHNPSAH